MIRKIIKILIPILILLFFQNNSSFATNEQDFTIFDMGNEVGILDYIGNSSEVVIPSSINGKAVTVICIDAFSNNNNLISVVIPDTVKEIGSNAFSNCFNLTNINIPNSVTTINSGAFYRCNSLTKITIPASVEKVDGFCECVSLENLEILEGVKELNGFVGCDRLKEVLIPDTVSSLGGFSNCKNLTKVTVPSNVSLIQTSTFYNCNNLVVYGYENTEIHKYAIKNNIKFHLLKEITVDIFNPIYYADMNIDLKKAFGYNKELLREHYYTFGIKEGRKVNPVFDPTYYLEKYNDLKVAFGNNYEQAYNHFVNLRNKRR